MLTIDKNDLNISRETINYDEKKKTIEEKRTKAAEFAEFRKMVDDLPIGGIYENNNCYYIISEKYDSSVKEKVRIERQLTNFTIEITQVIKFSKFYEIHTILTNDKKKKTEKIFMDHDFSSSKSIKGAINKGCVGLFFDGQDKEANSLIKYLYKNEPIEKIGIEKIGMHKIGNKYVAFDSFTNIDSDHNTSDDYVTLEKNKEIESNIISTDEITSDEIEKIFDSLFGFNHINKCVSVLGYVGSCFLKQKLNEVKIKLPHLFLIGESGSGKSSTLEEIILPIFNMTKGDTVSSGGVTKFTAQKTMSSSNLYPTVFEEFKPYKINKFVLNLISLFLRSAYDGHAIKSGRPTMYLETYQLESPVILVGEAKFEETAIEDRSHCLNFSKVYHNDECKSHYLNLKDNSELLRKLGKSLLMEALRIDVNEIKLNYYENLQLLKDIELNSRQIEGIATLMIGFTLLEKVIPNLFERLSINKDKLFRFFLEEKEVETKSIVENTLEIYDRLGFLMEGWHYTLVETKEGKAIALDVKGTYDKLKKYVSEHNLDDEVLTQKQFTTQLRNSKYFIKYEKAKLRKAYDPTSSTSEKQDSFIRPKCFYLKYYELEKLEMVNLISNED